MLRQVLEGLPITLIHDILVPLAEPGLSCVFTCFIQLLLMRLREVEYACHILALEEDFEGFELIE